MANSFVKWCRAKFFSGYKHINVITQEDGCSRSDTETLVRACEDDLLLPSTPTPPTPHHAHAQSASANSHHVASPGTYVEEVSCDVSVAAGEADRQEFSFTLYDFDGHGKVTKDDIAGLVRTIYEAVGSSLSLPPSGSRTIRVKLTVAPENCRGRQHDNRQHDASDGRKDDDIDPCEHPSGRSHRRRRTRRRSTSLQRHELLQIIQANMEKNNLFYTPLHRRHDHHHHHHDHHQHHTRRRRRHGCGCEHSGSPPDPPAEVKARLLEPECACRHTHYHSHTHGPTTTTARCVACRRHNRSHSHDLSHDSPHAFRYHLLDKTFQPLPPSNTPDQPPSPPVAAHAHHQHQYLHQPRHYHHHHHRSRSFDAGDTQGSSPRGRSGRLSRTQQQSQPQKEQQPQTQSKQDVLQGGGSEVSPHHTKQQHRHREADHARAMAQVVAWLERGSLLDSQKSPTSPESGSGGGSGSGACREQTHHVHQHIHHHYHHYAEKQPPPPLLI